MRLPANEALKLAAKERAERAAALEEAFLAIKQATGVSTVEEMVEKFLNQGARRGMACHGMAWHGIAWHGITWPGIACVAVMRSCLVGVVSGE